jgi:L-alanine-DL-glutamate epimerase-like enolase superfamily enzyme
VADVLVKVTTADGIVGWGECTRAADVPGIESAIKAMAPLVVGRSAWDREIMQRDLAVYALWAFQPMTANFAFAGIDMALWDACGKACGQPLYRLFGGAMREEVDYFYYMEWGTPKEIARQAQDGVKKVSRLLHQGRCRREEGGIDAGGPARRHRPPKARSASTSTRPGTCRRRCAC